MQGGYDVKCVTTEAASKFIGNSTLEGLSGNAVLTDMFSYEHNIEHISLVKWADLMLLCPATGNTINKFANGIADNLVGALFLANSFKKPYWIAPAMNSGMYENPITQKSIATLTELGSFFFETGMGKLACGDVGSGRLIDTDIIFDKITKEFR